MTNIDEALRESEERYRTLFDQAPVGVFLFDRALRLTACNPRFAEIMRSPAERLVGLDLAALPVEGLARLFRRALDGKVRSYEGTYHTALSGVSLALAMRVAPLRDGKGAVVGGMGVVEDVTERKAQEDALRRSEVSFRTLIHEAPDAIGVTREAVYVYANPAHVRLLGYEDMSDVVGRPVYDFLHPDDVARVRERAHVLRATDRVPPAELRLVRRDGDVLSVEVVSLRLEFDGQPAVISITRDISERKRMQARLMHTGRMESIGTLAAGVAHEINNPLAYVMANLDVLARRKLPQLRELARELETAAGTTVVRELAAGLERRVASVVDMIGVVREGAERVRNIVRDLRTFSRGADSERKGPIDVRSVLDASINIAWNEVRHRAKLVKHYEPVLLVEADESRLGQVFLNLLLNAAHALPAGDADHNTITVRTGTAPGPRVFVEVSDTGPGVPEALRQRIFDPFFTTKPVGVGTGLGLWISEGIVNGIGGDLTLETTNEPGATFRVTLPARTTPSVATASSMLPPAPGMLRGRVLVIDDELALGKALRSALGDEHVVFVATGGHEALSLLARDDDFDLVVCDLLMPDMTGMDVYEALRRTKPGLAERMAFVTGGAFTGAARDFIETVEQPVLDKPFDVDELRALLRARLRLREP